jgi:hypothetical protein
MYEILFLTYLRYSCIGGKFNHTYTGLAFRKVAFRINDVFWFLAWMDFRRGLFLLSTVPADGVSERLRICRWSLLTGVSVNSGVS